MKKDDARSSCITRHVFVSGIVQGVGFRWYTAREAQSRGLGGWVRNLRDGRVEVLICGSEEDVASMLNWLRIGPSAAEVSGIEVEERSEIVHDFQMLPTI